MPAGHQISKISGLGGDLSQFQGCIDFEKLMLIHLNSSQRVRDRIWIGMSISVWDI